LKINFEAVTSAAEASIIFVYPRRKVHAGYERAFIGTIRGFGCQIGGNGGSGSVSDYPTYQASGIESQEE
jgi:hypothetical protein